MGYPARVVSHPPCLQCGKPMTRKRYPNSMEDRKHFLARKYCDQRCMAGAMAALPPRTTSKKGLHYHSRKQIPKGPCQQCGAPVGTDVHHINHNWRDNRRENLIRLCALCHRRSHPIRKFCRLCGLPAKGYLLCSKHYVRWKRWGDPLATKQADGSMRYAI